jgi:hypothetical protein
MEMKTKKNFWVGASVVLIALLVSGCIGLKGMSPEEIKAFGLKPENQRWDIETKMADKNVPYEEQIFLYCDFGYGVKDKILTTYSKPLTVVVLPVGTERLWARYESGDKSYESEITFTSHLEAGQSYFLTDPLWEGRAYGAVLYTIVTLNDAGIAEYTRNMWDRNSGNSRGIWANGSYEEYHQYQTQVWQIRKEETRKQLNSKK